MAPQLLLEVSTVRCGRCWGEGLASACATSNVCDLAGTFSRWTALTLLPMLCCKIAYVYFQVPPRCESLRFL